MERLAYLVLEPDGMLEIRPLDGTKSFHIQIIEERWAELEAFVKPDVIYEVLYEQKWGHLLIRSKPPISALRKANTVLPRAPTCTSRGRTICPTPSARARSRITRARTAAGRTEWGVE